MQKYKFLPYNKNLVSVARELRKNQTEAEIKFGAFIKNCDFFKKYKFTTQKLLDNFIVDFYCSKLLLVIEKLLIAFTFKMSIFFEKFV